LIKINTDLFQKIKLIQALIDARRYSLKIERLLAITVVFVLLAIAVPYFDYISMKARTLSYYYQLDPIKHRTIVDQAVSGTWPSISKSFEDDFLQYDQVQLETITSQQGDFSISYNVAADDKIYTVGYRLVRYDHRQPTLHWTCGYSTARKDEVISDINVTSAPNELLNNRCHNKRNSR